ncbi:MAG: prealbumin-like fold domain-containing protein [Chloroflexota bacterium]
MTLRPSHPRAKSRWVLALSGVGLLVALAVGSTFAVHDATGPMELDGNIFDDSGAGDPRDWESIFDANGDEVAGNLPAGALDTTGVLDDFVPGASGPDPSYHEPSNKDDQAIDGTGGSEVWGCTSVANPTDKTDLVNAYGIAVTGDAATGDGDTADDQLFYFGVERYDNSGDAFIGLWLFQDDVTCNEATGKFEGSKQTGDILVLANFTGGGSDATVQLFKYTAGAGTSAGTFDLLGAGGACEDSLTGDQTSPENDLCATINDTNSFVTPWAMEDKTKPGPPTPDTANEVDPDQFVEGGVNLTDIFAATAGTPPPCFGSFLAETRSSSSLDATLKDFTLGDLNFCDVDISITPTETNEVGEQHTFTVDVDQLIGSGSGPATVGDVEYTLTGADGITDSDIVVDGGTCVDDPGSVEDDLDASGQCTIIFHSDVAGTITGHATVDVDLGGTIFTRETDGQGSNSGDAVKTYVDAYITVESDDTNEVNDAHTFTVTVYEDAGDGSGFVGADGEAVTITWPSGAPGTFDDSDCASTHDGGICYVTVNSVVAGTFDIHAAVSVGVGGLSLARETDGAGNNSGDATKVYVDASITIEADDTNEVGVGHTFTVTVYEDDGSGSGPVGADGEAVTITWPNGAPGTVDDSDCAATHDGGICYVAINSDVAGVFDVHAASNVQVGGLSLARETDGVAPNSGDATKTYVDAYITIEADDTNEINDAHTFTVYVAENDGGGFVGADNEAVTITFPNGAPGTVVATDCASTHDGGICYVVVNSAVAGVFDVHAAVSVGVGGLSLVRETDDTGNNSGDATKTYVDAYITINPDDTNGITEAHTFTVYVAENDGTGWADAAGEIVTITWPGGDGTPGTVDDSDCTDGTAADGTCLVIINSNVAGTFNAHAAVTVSVGSITVDRETDGTGGNSDAAVKIYLSGTLVWHKVDGNDDPLGGATFEVCRTETLDTSNFPETLVDEVPDICVSVLDNDTTPGAGEAADEDPADGEFLMTGLILGTYTVRETAAPAGYHIGSTDAVSAGSHSLDADPDILDLEIVDPFVNVRAFRLIVIGCDDITDTLEETEVWIDLDDDDEVDPGEVLNTITVVPPHLDLLGVTEADICGTEDDDVDTSPDDGIGGASYGGLAPRLYRATMLIPLL